jgi:mannose-6-phosphate isomerase
MYPFKFTPIYFHRIWGGRDFKLFREDLPKGNIGESWDVACHKHGTSIISNGEFKGMSLEDVVKLENEKVLGSEISKEWFPLLVKLINSKEKLSVQVHPDDKYAKEVEGEMGKTEVWYVVEAFQGANLVVGTKDCTKEQFEKATKEGNFEKYLNKVYVKKGDVYLVKSGLIHAIGEGVIVAEIQQNSDVTYRVYDYNRGREIHVEKAFEVVDLSLKSEKIIGITEEFENYKKTIYCTCEYFTLELYDIKKKFNEFSNKERFYIFTCVEGEGKIHYSNGEELIKVGDSILIPASLGEYKFLGTMKVLKSWVPGTTEKK